MVDKDFHNHDPTIACREVAVTVIGTEIKKPEAQIREFKALVEDPTAGTHVF